MQLFITHFELEKDKESLVPQVGDKIFISEERVVYQVTRVLRGKVGMQFFVQLPHFAGEETLIQRYLVSVVAIEKKQLICEIENIEKQKIYPKEGKICIAIPNKIEKMELIVQKITELGLQYIVFFPAQYSQLQEISSNKLERLQKIAWEAVEQSYGDIIPKIFFEKDIKNILCEGKNFQLHQDGKEKNNRTIDKDTKENFFVGPEGGRGENDQKIFDEYNIEKISLGKNILRTETAAIITAWEAIR